MRIGITYDLKSSVPVKRYLPDDFQEEFDSPATIEAIASVLRELGHEVVLLGDGRGFLEKLLTCPPDFVFNIAEGEGIGRSREARVPAALEMLGIGYTGSDPLTLAVTLDKDCAKRLVQSAAVAVPRAVVVPFSASQEQSQVQDNPGASFRGVAGAGVIGNPLALQTGASEDTSLSHPSSPGHLPDEVTYASGPLWDQEFPVIVKPAWEGSSKGIRQSSIVDRAADLPSVVHSLLRDHRQPVLIEEYIAGDELTVGIIGNGSPEIIGIMRVLPQQSTDRFVYSLEVKRDWERQVRYECPALLSPADTAAVRRSAFLAYHVLGCRDVARVDFRLRNGVPYFLEVNPLPGLNPDSGDLVLMSGYCGWTYHRLIASILQTALDRAAHDSPLTRP
jgi:D-alanine-D-alanine ligase